MRTYFAALSFALAAVACLNIERTEPAESTAGTGGGGGQSAGSGGASIDPDFMPTACVQQCVDKTPAGAAVFSGVSSCFDRARVGTCAEACSTQPSGEVAPSTCALPSSIDPNPACNNCIKDNCCTRLQECFSTPACITVGICASGCNG